MAFLLFCLHLQEGEWSIGYLLKGRKTAFCFDFIHTYRMFEKLGVNSSPALLTCPRVPGHCCLSWSRSKSPFCRLGLYGNCGFFRVPTSTKHLQQIQINILVCLSLHFPKGLSDSSALLVFMDALPCLSGFSERIWKAPDLFKLHCCLKTSGHGATLRISWSFLELCYWGGNYTVLSWNRAYEPGTMLRTRHSAAGLGCLGSASLGACGDGWF